MSMLDFDEVVEHYQRALEEFVKGNPEPNKRLFSHQEDVTLANPLGPAVRGWEQVAATMERAASQVSEGEIVAFENVARYQAWRKAGDRPIRSAGDDDLSARRWHLEGGTSTRRPDHHGEASRIGHPAVDQSPTV